MINIKQLRAIKNLDHISIINIFWKRALFCFVALDFVVGKI